MFKLLKKRKSKLGLNDFVERVVPYASEKIQSLEAQVNFVTLLPITRPRKVEIVDVKNGEICFYASSSLAKKSYISMKINTKNSYLGEIIGPITHKEKDSEYGMYFYRMSYSEDTTLRVSLNPISPLNYAKYCEYYGDNT